MRWFSIRKAKNIDPELRKTFERYGAVGMQIVLGGDMNHFFHQGQMMKADAVLDPLLDWLIEEYDKADRKSTWSMTMEFFITIFVGFELYLSVIAR